MNRHAPRRVIGGAVIAAALSVPLAASPITAHAERGDDSGGHRSITVMTRNMDEGTDFGYLVGPGALPFAIAAPATYGEVLASDIPGRAAAMADEIATAKPDLVALQEAAVWTGPNPGNPTQTITLDMLQFLMARLAADGAAYAPVVVVPEAQIAASIGPATVTFLDRDVILARTDNEDGELELHNASSGHFANQLIVPITPTLTVTVTRGWASVDATQHGRTVRFIATHLESFNYGVQLAQAQELVAGPASTELPVIVAGDLNTGPNINPSPIGPAQLGTYNWLVSPTGGHFVDTWSVTQPGVPGFTDSFYTEDPKTPSTPTERIDLVLVRGPLTPLTDYLVGTSIPHPSDHAGVVARIGIHSNDD